MIVAAVVRRAAVDGNVTRMMTTGATLRGGPGRAGTMRMTAGEGAGEAVGSVIRKDTLKRPAKAGRSAAFLRVRATKMTMIGGTLRDAADQAAMMKMMAGVAAGEAAGSVIRKDTRRHRVGDGRSVESLLA